MEDEGFDGVTLGFLILCVAGFVGLLMWMAAKENQDDVVTYEQRVINSHESSLDNLIYYQDAETGICFAMTGKMLNRRDATLAYVPCDGLDPVMFNTGE
jgi:hypothetical protein